MPPGKSGTAQGGRQFGVGLAAGRRTASPRDGSVSDSAESGASTQGYHREGLARSPVSRRARHAVFRDRPSRYTSVDGAGTLVSGSFQAAGAMNSSTARTSAA
jgi:hypothetical protein